MFRSRSSLQAQNSGGDAAFVSSSLTRNIKPRIKRNSHWAAFLAIRQPQPFPPNSPRLTLLSAPPKRAEPEPGKRQGETNGNRNSPRRGTSRGVFHVFADARDTAEQCHQIGRAHV